MSSHGVIADIGITLKRLLERDLAGLVTPDNILLSSPAEMEVTANRQLCIFLYQVTENPALRNNPEPRSAEPPFLPPFPVDLHYLFIAYAQEREDEHRILGRLMQSFHDNAMLAGSLLQGTSLAGSDESLRLVFHGMSLDESTKLWAAFPGKSFRLSLSYLVTPALISSARTEGGGRVLTRALDVAQVKPAAGARND
jgi:hypothetical protein